MLYRYLFITISTLASLACARALRDNYDVEITSPKGTYRVKVEIRAEEPKGTRDHTEHGKIQFFKRQELVDTHEWEQTDQWEPSFRDTTPVIEWIDDSMLRMGDDRSSQPFLDEVLILNNTDEYLKYMDVTYGKYESFKVFDIAPKSQVALRASPHFRPDNTSNSALGYGGMTRSGKEFHDAIYGKEKRTRAEGPLSFHITINTKDLR